MSNKMRGGESSPTMMRVKRALENSERRSVDKRFGRI